MAGDTTARGLGLMATTLGLAAAYMFVWGLAPWRGLSHHCHPFYDLGIYGQASATLGVTALNPVVPAFGHGIFNDHFDPILWLTVLLRPWLGGPGAVVVVEAASAVAAALAPLWLALRGHIAARTAALGTLLLLFNPGQVSAAAFAGHPTTWAAAPMAWLTACLAERRPTGATVALALLCACKEEFGFAALVVAATLAYRREVRWAAATFAVAAMALGLAFVARPLWWGGTTAHAAKLWAGLDGGLGPYLWRRLSHPGALSRAMSLTASLAPLGAWLWCRRRRVPAWLLSPLAAPLAIRFLGTAWRHHYMGCVMAGAVVALVWSCGRAPVARWVVAATVVAICWTTVNPTRHALRLLAGEVIACPPTPARLASIAAGVAWLGAHQEGRVAVSSNLVTALAARPQVYPLGAPVSGAPYSALLVEQPPLGESWPLSGQDVSELVATWRADPRARVIRDDAWVFLAACDSIL